jgi:hypothetical protein
VVGRGAGGLHQTWACARCGLGAGRQACGSRPPTLAGVLARVLAHGLELAVVQVAPEHLRVRQSGAR